MGFWDRKKPQRRLGRVGGSVVMLVFVDGDNAGVATFFYDFYFLMMRNAVTCERTVLGAVGLIGFNKIDQCVKAIFGEADTTTFIDD